MPPFDEFWASGDYIEFPVTGDANAWVRYAEFREDPELNALGTPSGKFEIYSQRIAKMNYPDCGPFPRWYAPEEWSQSPQSKDFPLGLLSAHPPFRLHSQLSNTSLRQKYAVADREPMLIHPKDAAPRDIKSGDVVRLRSPHGAVPRAPWSPRTSRPATSSWRRAAGTTPPSPAIRSRCASTAA